MKKNNKDKTKYLGLDMSWIEANESELVDIDSVKASTSIALRLRSYLKTHGFKQAELAEKLQVSPQYVNRLLRGRVNLTVGTACKYGRLLNFSLIDMLEPDESIYSSSNMEKLRNNIHQIYNSIHGAFDYDNILVISKDTLNLEPKDKNLPELVLYEADKKWERK